MCEDIVAALREGIEEVIAGRLSRQEWYAGARQRLIRAGYWREEGEKGGITPSRLQLIFDTNTANAYHGGRWQRLEERRETHPYLMYLTKRDHRVRPEHRAWEGLILPIDHPFWQTHFPPNGFRCRCAVLGVTQAEYDQLKRDGGQFAGGTVKFDNDIDADLESLDPGFAYNPGIPGSRAAALQRLAEEKAARAAEAARGKSKIGEETPARAAILSQQSAIEARDGDLPALTRKTERTSAQEAAKDVNAPGRAQIADARDKHKSLIRERDAISRATKEGRAAWDAKDKECSAAREEYERLVNAYTRNCQRCVIAYELRRRGYDVTALAYIDEEDEILKRWPEVFGGKLYGVKEADTNSALSSLEAKISSYGDGSRSIVIVHWDDDENDNGHAFIAENIHGKVVYIDPQSGVVGYQRWKTKFKPNSVAVFRVDDKPINMTHLGRIVREAK
ncbi:MAG: minor capsid protein [Rhodocyclaceae bacterium]|nr:minor capsid protein [Rhodocyclaceae bacterium]